MAMTPRFIVIPVLLILLASCTARGVGPTMSPFLPSSGGPVSPTSEGAAPAGPLAVACAALDAYQPPQATPEILQTLTSGIAGWLSSRNDPSLLPGLLRTFPKLQTTRPAVDQADLNGDGLGDVVVQTQLMGLPVLVFLQQEDGQYVGLTLPETFDEPLPTLESGFLTRDLPGDGRPETVVTSTVPGGSMSTELLYVFRWREVSPTLAFRADLITWAGPSAWTLQPDPTASGRQQFLLTYPHLYRDGFDHKMVNHPLGWQIWRWDEAAGYFVLAEKTDILYPPAGLTAYLTTHPELSGDPEAIRAGLEAVGFALDEVRQADGGSLWLIVQAGGIPTGWTLVRDADGRWRPYQPPACSPLRPCWPRVGGFEE